MIRVLAIDDEPFALQQITAYINKIPYFDLVKACQSAAEALEVIQTEMIDAIFVDINMPDLNGMDFVKQLASPPTQSMLLRDSKWMLWTICLNLLDCKISSVPHSG